MENNEVKTLEPIKVRRERAVDRKYRIFAEAYLDFTKPTYLNGTRSAIAAGYKTTCANYMASTLLKHPKVIALLEQVERKQAEEHEVTVDWIKQEYVSLYKTCLREKDRTNAKGCLGDLGKMFGAFIDVQKTEVTDNRALDISEEEDEMLENIGREYKIRLSS